MKTLSAACALLIGFTSTCFPAGIVTLTVKNFSGTQVTNDLTIESYEVAEVLSLVDNGGNGAHLLELKILDKDGDGPTLRPPLTQSVFVAGPVKLRLIAVENPGVGFCTVRVTPEAYPPDKSILVPPGAGGAAINLECSTNLVDWMATTNGVYTNLPAAKFFRIKTERIQP